MKNNSNNNLYPMVWKWHFIGGFLSAPFAVMLAITGIIYLFKDTYEAPQKKQLTQLVHKNEPKMSFQQQWDFAKISWEKVPTSMILPKNEMETTEFISGKFSHKSSLFIDPYAQKVKGTINVNETNMHKVRKLHGELLLGKYGKKVIELVASWMVVLLITGLFLFWPRGRGWKGFFTIRSNQTKRILYRDIHALIGFWFSLLLLIVLAGGLPWTDVFGKSFKWIQKKTNTGFPATWESRNVKSNPNVKTISLDEIVLKAKQLNLVGETIIELPQNQKGVYSIYNETNNLAAVKKFHIDQYSGTILVSHTWDDIGILMKGRIWVMAFHQGEFGLWNWYLMIFVSIGLLLISVATIISYGYRKKPNSLSIPKGTNNFSPSIAILIIIIFLGITLPLFGLSVVIIFLYDKLNFKKNRKMMSKTNYF